MRSLFLAPRIPHMTAKYNAFLSRVEPRFVIRFLVAENFPEEKTLGSIPANATSFFASLNDEISPISAIIVAAILSPIPGIERNKSNPGIHEAIFLSLAQGL